MSPTWPVEVSGTVESYAWPDAEAQAVQQVGRLCDVLSLLSHASWRLLESPRPSSWPSLVFLRKEQVGTEYQYPFPAAQEFAVGDVETHWRALASNNPLLASLCSTHRNAMAIFSDQPSYSALGFIAVLEQIATQRKSDLERCACCGAIRGYGAGVRWALREALEDSAASMVADAYDERSKTAHRGSLWGFEDHFSYLPTFPDLDTGSAIYQYPQVYWLSRASQRWLLSMISGEPVRSYRHRMIDGASGYSESHGLSYYHEVEDGPGPLVWVPNNRTPTTQVRGWIPGVYRVRAMVRNLKAETGAEALNITITEAANVNDGGSERAYPADEP